jgi:hypothetical protein
MITLTDGMPVDLPVLLETRLLVQANSGGGKSWVLRRLLEQTAPHVQQLIIDPEGEFATLRERFDYVIAAAHDGDALASPQTAAMLARRLLESGVSAVLDIYDLKAHERQQFVRRFLDALVNAPRKLWHPVLVVLDEAHVFCPQAGSAEAAPAVIDLATRGRKRGLCLVAATQRLSKLHKDVAAELLNQLIGRTGLDVDVKRAGDELGLVARDALLALRTLAPGEFFAFGPALRAIPERLSVGPVATTHPKAGQRLLQAPPPASAKVREQLAKLADLQKDAEQEARTVEDLQRQNAELTRQLRAAKQAATGASTIGVPEDEVQRRVAEARREASSPPVDEKRIRTIASLAMQIGAECGRALGMQPDAEPAPRSVSQSTSAPAGPASRAKAVTSGLTGPEQRILDAIAWMNAIGVAEPEQTAVAFVAGYTIGGGAWNNPRGSLRTKGLIEYRGGSLVLTDAGAAKANPPDVQPGNAALHAAVMARLPGPERKLLQVLLDTYPSALSNDELAARAGYAPKGGAFNNPRARLRTLGLIEFQPGTVRARDILIPERTHG